MCVSFYAKNEASLFSCLLTPIHDNNSRMIRIPQGMKNMHIASYKFYVEEIKVAYVCSCSGEFQNS